MGQGPRHKAKAYSPKRIVVGTKVLTGKCHCKSQGKKKLAG